jgi:hypothetical protein
MQFQGQGKPAVGVIFDSDMGNTIDDALALAVLYGLQAKGDARVASVSVTKSSLQAAEFTDALVRFYSGEPGPFAIPLPIGLSLTGKGREDTPMMGAVLDRKTPEGKPQYARGIHKMNDTADPAALIRNAFTAQQDENALVVLTGPATNLVQALDLPGTKQLVAQKVRYLTMADIQGDPPSARRLLAEWPARVVFAPPEIGDAFQFPGASIDANFAWAPAHPIVDAYRSYKTMPYDATATALAAVLYAVRPGEGYFKLSDPGTIAVLDDGRTKFTASAEGKHRYLIADPAQKERVLAAYVELASERPKPRQRPFPKKQ